MYTFCGYTRAELLESEGKTFWATCDNKNMRGAIKVIDNSIYLLHDREGIGAIGYNLSDEDKDGYMYDWCIYDDARYYDEVDNMEYLFKDFAISKEPSVKKKKDFKLQVKQALDKRIEVVAVDAETGAHLKYLLCVTDEGIFRYADARPNQDEYNIPKEMFNKGGFINIKKR